MKGNAEDKPLTRRTMQKQETRRHILESAYILFEQQGYEQATMRKLAKLSGIGLGTVFKHFPDKPSLLVAAFKEDIQAVSDQAFEALPENNLQRQLSHIVTVMYGYYARNHAFSKALVKEALFIEGPAGEIIHAQTMDFLKRVGLLIQEAVTRKEISQVADLMQAITAFWSFYMLGLTVGLRNEPFDVNKQVEMVSGLLQAHFPPLQVSEEKQ